MQPLPAAGDVTADVTVSGRSVGVLFCLQPQSQLTHPRAPATEGVGCCDFTTVLKTTWCCNAPATGVPDLCVMAAAGWVLCTNTTWSSWEKHRGLSEKKMWRSYFTDVKTLRTYIYLLKLWSALTWCCDAKSIPCFSVYDVIKNPTRTYSFWYKSVIINLHTDIRCQSLQSDVHFKVASILVRSVCWSSSRCFLFFFHCSVSILSAFNQIHSGMKTVCFVCCSTILFGLRMTGLLFYLSQPQNVGYMHVVHKLAIAVDFVVGSSKHRMWLKVFDQSVFVCARSFWSGCCKRGLYWSWTCLTGMKQAQLKLSARSVQRSVQHLLWRRCANCPRLLMYTYVSHALVCAGVAIACRHCSVRCWWFIVYCLHNI